MNCDDIQNLILTDYSDNQLIAETKKQVDAHLEQCSQCREFAKAVKEKVFVPFENADSVSPPDSIWDSIKEEIDEGYEYVPEETRPNPWDWLRGLQFLRMPAVQFTLAAFFITTVVFSVNSLRNPSVAKIIHQKAVNGQTAKDQEKSLEDAYLAFIIEDIAPAEEQLNEYGTAIEEYFL